MTSAPSKKVFNKRYFHTDTLSLQRTDDLEQVLRAARLAEINPGEAFNVVRLEDESTQIALLRYRNFFDSPFPELEERWLVDLSKGQTSHRTYKESLNPPILHRKELLVPRDHPRRKEYAALTNSAEQIGLFDQPTRIGYRAQWSHLIKERGYTLVEHQLVPLGNDQSDEKNEDEGAPEYLIARHRTALVRYGFSAPIQSLARDGYLDGSYTLFDYGCGRGDDVHGLIENEIAASGWDPYFAPDKPIQEADIVNLGFVINVIENFDERIETLIRAYSLSNQLLVVSVMLTNSNNTAGTSLNDGVLTKRSTFQKYYSQAEFIAFIKAVLDEDPIPVSPGVLYVFRDKDAEQRFLANRYKSYRRLPVRSSTLRSQSRVAQRNADVEAKYTEYKTLLESLWDTCLNLGRKPDPSEVPMLTELVEGFGSLPKAFRFISSRKDCAALERARLRRLDDITVFMALQHFEGKKTYKHLESGLRRDIKAFFGTMKAAKVSGLDLLFKIANTDLIDQCCRQASEQGLGFYQVNESLQLHTSLIELLPPVLRVYVGCAAALYGDYHNADLIKIHIGSSKLTLMRYDDFEGKPLPRMIERVKLKLRDQDIEYFNYEHSGFEPPYLYRKSNYVNEEFASYPEQLEFDKQLESLCFFDLSGYGPNPETFHDLLERHRWCIKGFELKRTQTIPDIDTKCGNHLTYRQLIECGETQVTTRIPNLPKNPDSYSALLDLTIKILDPVIDYFGMIKLTYGLCSTELSRAITKRVAPKLDQHAAHEKRRNGHFVCKRLGAAVDFLVEDEDMQEVAEWVAANTPFDRLYYYGKELPIHVSFGPEQSRSFIEMLESSKGRLTPRTRKLPQYYASNNKPTS